MKYDIPIAEDLVDRLMPFWASIFGEGGDLDRTLFLGEETDWHDTILYIEEDGGRPVATCLTVRSKGLPAVAGFAEVATDPAYRGRGLASELCRCAVEDFQAAGGEAFFLGTGNPGAARIYDRLGWRRMAGANVMTNITGEDSPEEFLVDFFRHQGDVTVGPAAPDVRIPMIPLIWTPHDSQVLDANVGLFGRRYVIQHSCMGLYPRFTRSLEGCGAWFAARTGDGRVVGLSSARLNDKGACRVDGFTHHRFDGSWEALIEAAIDWGQSHGAGAVNAAVSIEDERKRARFEAVGFGIVGGTEETFDLGDRSVVAVHLSRSR